MQPVSRIARKALSRNLAFTLRYENNYPDMMLEGGRQRADARPPHAPREVTLVDRSDLLTALDEAAAGKVAVISAPAGSGKTCLLRAWIARRDQRYRVAGVQVARDQQDAQQFWLAVLAAVRKAGGTENPVTPTATPSFDGQAMVDRVRAELEEQGDTTFLVIDDLHELTSPAALAQLARLLGSLPPNAHAIVATRRDLPLHLHQLRLAGELTEIRSADLRFTERETRELLSASGIVLSDAGVTLLHQRTEGWAAGLRLAAISLAGRSDPERFVAEFSGSSRTVAEYLIAEMLEGQPTEVQQLLIRTSLLDRVNGELGDLLTGHAGSERILLDLEDANAFVVSLDPDRTWFRYHHLFADLLRLELRRTQSGEVPGLHRLAAEWLMEHGYLVDAIRHTQAAGDWSDAARLLADHSFSLTLDGQTQTIQGLLSAFPPGAAANGPDLALARATSELAQGQLDDAAAHLAVAETYVETAPPDRRHRLSVTIASLKLYLARRRGNLADVVEQAQFLASPISAESDEDVALDSDLRAVALMNLGTVEAWSLASANSERHLQEGADLARKIRRPYLEVGCLAQLAFASKIRPFATTRQLCVDAISLAESYGWGAEPIISPALVTLAGVTIWTGGFDEGEQLLQRTAKALESDTGPGIRILLRLTTGMLRACRGRYDEALAEFSAAEELQTRLAGPHALENQLIGWKVATQARLGLRDEAQASLGALDDDRTNAGEIRNAEAVICLTDRAPTQALGHLQAVLDGTAPVIGYVTVVESFLLAADAYHDLSDHRAAVTSVERALALSEADRLVLPFAMTASVKLLESMPRHETAHAGLLTDILDVLHGSSLASSEKKFVQMEQLSRSELKVLRFLPTNLSRLEIASELSVSVNTVNTHIRNIYAKLGAQDRSSAVQRARDLRLLSTGLNRS
jgi:LuxR family transcriptional regulator, maltose regulon positive regulatory protein